MDGGRWIVDGGSQPVIKPESTVIGCKQETSFGGCSGISRRQSSERAGGRMRRTSGVESERGNRVAIIIIIIIIILLYFIF